jgi:hypothetical protein
MASGRRPALSDQQIVEIIRRRLNGQDYKTIAQRVGCTPDQAIHYWRTSTAYQPQPERSKAAKQRQAKSAAHARAALVAKAAEAERAAALATLRQEIALAVIEAPTAPLYKSGDLVWG